MRRLYSTYDRNRPRSGLGLQNRGPQLRPDRPALAGRILSESQAGMCCYVVLHCGVGPKVGCDALASHSSLALPDLLFVAPCLLHALVLLAFSGTTNVDHNGSSSLPDD